MENLKNMKNVLMAQAQAQMGNLSKVDAKELGEVVDMIKDLEEAIYYCTVVKAMEESKEEKTKVEHYYTEYLPYEKSYVHNPYRDMDIPMGKMYYSEGGGRGGNSSSGGNSGNMGGNRNYESQFHMDEKTGRSPITRRNYMEMKETHQDKNLQMQELEKYMKELSADVTEMIAGATPEEKQLLKQKMTTLIGMIK